MELNLASTSRKKEMPALIPRKRARIKEERTPSVKRGVESQSKDRDSSEQDGARSKDPGSHPEAGSPKGGSITNLGSQPKGLWHPPMKYPKMTNVQMLVERSRPFWEARTGRSLCPVCSGSPSTGHSRILYSRDTFLRH